MKKRIIFGVCVTTLFLLVAPTISAQEHIQVNEAIKLDLEEKIDNLINSFEIINSKTNELEYHKNMIIDAFDSIDKKIEMIDLETQPLFIKFLLSTIISLIFAIFGTIFGIVFGPLLAILVKILTAPAILLGKIISFIINGFPDFDI